MEWYPLQFEPILKKILWGGSEISRFKSLPVEECGIGESWDVSQVSGSVSVVNAGPYKGKSLTELMQLAPEELLGKKVYQRFGMRFPLLIKFIDAAEDLSIQVHPGDQLAAERHNCFGKTEMWYVVDARPDARVVAGFSKEITSEEYARRVQENTLEEVLRSIRVMPGDVLFIPPGRIHAICSGLFLVEIQQSSDITYRIYDYNRKDCNGNLRELHTALAADAIDFEHNESLKLTYEPLENDLTPLIACPYFTTNRIHLKADESGFETLDTPEGRIQVPMIETLEMDRDYQGLDSFIVYVCVKGEGKIQYGEDAYHPVSQGDTILLPAVLDRVVISTENELILLETYI